MFSITVPELVACFSSSVGGAISRTAARQRRAVAMKNYAEMNKLIVVRIDQVRNENP